MIPVQKVDDFSVLTPAVCIVNLCIRMHGYVIGNEKLLVSDVPSSSLLSLAPLPFFYLLLPFPLTRTISNNQIISIQVLMKFLSQPGLR